MSDLFGNHIVGFPTRWLISCHCVSHLHTDIVHPETKNDQEQPTQKKPISYNRELSTQQDDLCHYENMPMQ